MIDREKVLKGLEWVINDIKENGNINHAGQHLTEIKDALELIDAQQKTLQEYESLIAKIVAALGLLGIAEENKKTNKNPLDSLSEAELIEPMKHFQD